ncbi:MAG: class I SAM-dependent methyltransferase [Zavarzinella sp.]
MFESDLFPEMIANLQKWDDPTTLTHLQNVRRPYHQFAMEIVKDVLPELSRLQVLEIGCGDGQLIHWLPNGAPAGYRCLEASERFVEAFRTKFPQVPIEQGDATNIPLPDSSVDLVLALCVFDSFPNPAKVRTELARILKPGGQIIHFLDLSVNPLRPFLELYLQSLLPLPNFLGDADWLPPDQLLPPTEIEVVTIPIQQIQKIPTSNVTSHQRGLELLREYIQLFQQPLEQFRKFVTYYMRITSSPEWLSELNQANLAVTELNLRTHRAWDLQPLSLRQWYEQLNSSQYLPATGFTEMTHQLLTRAGWRVRAESDPENRTIQRRTVGRSFWSDAAPPADAPENQVHTRYEILISSCTRLDE